MRGFGPVFYLLKTALLYIGLSLATKSLLMGKLSLKCINLINFEAFLFGLYGQIAENVQHNN